MTKREAIKILDERITFGKKEYSDVAGEYIEALEIAIQALKEQQKNTKEIPFKPTKCNITLGRCKCGVGFMDKLTNYCGNCGQKLDWGEE